MRVCDGWKRDESVWWEERDESVWWEESVSLESPE
jgi:hypothetical protein